MLRAKEHVAMCTLAASVKNILVRPDPVDDGETQVLATCDQGLCPLRGVSGTARSGFFLGEPLRLYRAPVGAEEGSQLFRGDIAVPIWDSWSASVYFKSGCAVFRLVGDQVTLVAGNPTTAGEEDGPGPEARFEAGHLPGQPGQLASDGAGSIIYAGGETLRRIRLPGAWRAVAPVVAAGGAAAGGADGAAAAADGAPDDVALVATLGDLALYHVDTQSVAYVPAPQPPQPPPQQQQAGGGQDMMVGREDGRGDRAAFTGFVGITADASGFVYLLDKQPTEGRLRRVSPDGTVTTLVQGLPACLCTPTILPNGYLALGTGTELVLLDLGLKPLLPQLQPPPAAGAAALVAAAPPPRSLPSDLGALLEAASDGADTAVVVGGRRFHCHRLILSARCDYFRQRLAGDGFADARAAELELPDADADAFALLLRWLYTGGADIPAEQARGVAELADRLLLPELCDAALEVVASAAAADNVVDRLLWAAACCDARGSGGGGGGGASSFARLLARLKGWYVEHHGQVAAEAGASRKRLAEAAPGLSVELTDALIAWEREGARERAKRPRC
eukprot:XP_001700338.1 predicted protein [Chlamydomonas reinhardtii]